MATDSRAACEDVGRVFEVNGNSWEFCTQCSPNRGISYATHAVAVFYAKKLAIQ